MRTRIKIYRPDKPVELRKVELNAGRLEDIKRVVEPITGGPMEHVNVFWGFDSASPRERYRDMFVNEHGKLQGLKRNVHATVIYRNNTMVHAPVHDPEELDDIVGNAVLFERKVWR
jgi:hypothetical protein